MYCFPCSPSILTLYSYCMCTIVKMIQGTSCARAHLHIPSTGPAATYRPNSSSSKHTQLPYTACLGSLAPPDLQPLGCPHQASSAYTGELTRSHIRFTRLLVGSVRWAKSLRSLSQATPDSYAMQPPCCCFCTSTKSAQDKTHSLPRSVGTFVDRTPPQHKTAFWKMTPEKAIPSKVHISGCLDMCHTTVITNSACGSRHRSPRAVCLSVRYPAPLTIKAAIHRLYL